MHGERRFGAYRGQNEKRFAVKNMRQCVKLRHFPIVQEPDMLEEKANPLFH